MTAPLDDWARLSHAERCAYARGVANTYRDVAAVFDEAFTAPPARDPLGAVFSKISAQWKTAEAYFLADTSAEEPPSAADLAAAAASAADLAAAAVTELPLPLRRGPGGVR